MSLAAAALILFQATNIAQWDPYPVESADTIRVYVKPDYQPDWVLACTVPSTEVNCRTIIERQTPGPMTLQFVARAYNGENESVDSNMETVQWTLCEFATRLELLNCLGVE